MFFFLIFSFLINQNDYLDTEDSFRWLLILGLTCYILIASLIQYKWFLLTSIALCDFIYTRYYYKYQQKTSVIYCKKPKSIKKNLIQKIANDCYKQYCQSSDKNPFTILVPTIDYTLKHTLENIIQ